MIKKQTKKKKIHLLKEIVEDLEDKCIDEPIQEKKKLFNLGGKKKKRKMGVIISLDGNCNIKEFHKTRLDDISDIDLSKVFYYKKMPVIWYDSVAGKQIERSPLSGINDTYAQRLVLAGIQEKAETSRKKIGWVAVIIGIIILAIIGYSFLTGG